MNLFRIDRLEMLARARHMLDIASRKSWDARFRAECPETWKNLQPLKKLDARWRRWKRRHSKRW